MHLLLELENTIGNECYNAISRTEVQTALKARVGNFAIQSPLLIHNGGKVTQAGACRFADGATGRAI
jgi:hypothetical protein